MGNNRTTTHWLKKFWSGTLKLNHNAVVWHHFVFLISNRIDTQTDVGWWPIQCENLGLMPDQHLFQDSYHLEWFELWHNINTLIFQPMNLMTMHGFMKYHRYMQKVIVFVQLCTNSFLVFTQQYSEKYLPMLRDAISSELYGILTFNVRGRN